MATVSTKQSFREILFSVGNTKLNLSLQINLTLYNTLPPTTPLNFMVCSPDTTDIVSGVALRSASLVGEKDMLFKWVLE